MNAKITKQNRRQVKLTPQQEVLRKAFLSVMQKVEGSAIYALVLSVAISE